MFEDTLKQYFLAMGAEVDVARGGDRFEIDVRNTDGHEVFEIRRKRVKRHRRGNRQSAPYVRQGEWFFVPCPQFDADRHIVAHDGTLARSQGKPHHVDRLCRPEDGETYVCGKVQHPDHRTIYLYGWHKVLRKTPIVRSALMTSATVIPVP